MGEKRERRVVALSSVRDILKRDGKEHLLKEIVNGRTKQIRIREKDKKEIIRRLEEDGFCLLKRKNGEPNKFLFCGKEHVRWSYTFNRMKPRKTKAHAEPGQSPAAAAA